jgi:hypothetical protein
MLPSICAVTHIVPIFCAVYIYLVGHCILGIDNVYTIWYNYSITKTH